MENSCIAFAVLLLVGIAPGGVPPAYGRDSKGVVDYFAVHGTGLQATFFLGNVLPTVLGSIFTGVLAVAIWKADADARFGAVVGVIVVFCPSLLFVVFLTTLEPVTLRSVSKNSVA